MVIWGEISVKEDVELKFKMCPEKISVKLGSLRI
jgi:hypothetical protein